MINAKPQIRRLCVCYDMGGDDAGTDWRPGLGGPGRETLPRPIPNELWRWRSREILGPDGAGEGGTKTKYAIQQWHRQEGEIRPCSAGSPEHAEATMSGAIRKYASHLILVGEARASDGVG